MLCDPEAEAGAVEVTVVVPTHDRWQRLERTLRCALGQNDVDLEVIVVDDASADAGALDRLVAKLDDSRLRTVALSTNKGMAAARNAGVSCARGDWIAFLDDDDLWSPSKLRNQLRAAGDAGMVYSGAVEVGADGRVIRVVQPPEPTSLREALRTGNVIPAAASNVIVRRNSFLTVGMFDEQLLHLSDWDAWIRLSESVEAAVDRTISVAYMKHEANRGPRHINEVVQDARLLRERHGPAMDGSALAIDNWLAATARQSGRRFAASRLYVRSAIRNNHPSDLLRAVGCLVPASSRHRHTPVPEWLVEALAEL